jgi:outer membrane protein assembly factor BamB
MLQIFSDEPYGLSAETGDVLWENTNESGYSDHSLRKVTLGDRHFAFVAGHRHQNPSNVRMIDPATGRSLWTERVGLLGVYEGLFANTLAIAGNTLVTFQPHIPEPDPETTRIRKEDVTHHIHAWQLSTSGIKHLWQDDHLPPDEGPHLAIASGVVYGVGRHQVRCLDLQTGNLLGKITESEFPHPADSPHVDAPGSNPLLIIAGDRLFLSPEGQHGRHGFVLFDADPSRLTLFGDQEREWLPPHASTTAYGRQPIVNPIVDGRAFFRGGNGIYCYDLRQSQQRIEK